MAAALVTCSEGCWEAAARLPGQARRRLAAARNPVRDPRLGGRESRPRPEEAPPAREDTPRGGTNPDW
ncbi:hypothetical protein [Nonomuraea dietziae]|uniref:hypothetical protein n=1 Tax=Nonomuraea dietziae TaxID=65515 RepID=UPI0031CEF739